MVSVDSFPTTCSVIVVGAGLSGLVAARDLVRSGITDVIVVEARDRVGGRLDELKRPNGSSLMRGGEFVGSTAAQLLALGAELGVETEVIPPYRNEGKFVRIFQGERLVESYPLESDPEAAAAFASVVAAFEAIAETIPVDEPWTHPDARALDHVSFGSWLDEHVPNRAAREAFYGEFVAFGDPREVSLFYTAWYTACFGGLEGMSNSLRFIGGTAQLPQLMAAELGPRVVLSAPVRRVEHSSESVTVHTDLGAITADSVIFAMEPGQCAKIEFEPALPAARDRIQDRWLAGHGVKINAIYDRPFWREEGLAGAASGPGPIQLAVDVSETGSDEGALCAFFFASNPSLADYSDVLGDPDRVREMVLAGLVEFYGPEAASPKEFYVFDWSGDRWSEGCGSQVPVGVLSTVGQALRVPVGRILWAGAEAGERDYMEGAVTAGQRAAREAREIVIA